MPGRGGGLRPVFIVLYYITASVLSQYRSCLKTVAIGYNENEVIAMAVKFTMPMDGDIARKMTYIGKYYGRSRIKEIEWACKEWITRFETEQGKITPEDLRALKEEAGE